jgi:phosphohistidine phosphatase
MRHAKSSWRDTELADHERPLAERGRRDAPRMGERLDARSARPGLILTSSAKRALETARIVAAALGYPHEALHVEPALYLADPGAILRVVAGQEDEVANLLLVGHNPGLTELVNRLLPDLRLNDLPTAGIVAMDSTAARWADLGPQNTTLAFYDYPKNPEASVTRE